MIVNFHPQEAPLRCNVLASHQFSDFMIFESGLDGKHTYAMTLLNKSWDRGDTVRIWYQSEDGYTYKEFNHGDVVNGKVLKKEHNLQKLWQSGALGSEMAEGLLK